VLESIRLGARGYVLKDSPSTELVKAIRAVHADETFVSKCFEGLIRQTALNQVFGQAAESKPASLTKRERMILQQIAAGDATDRIAQLFGISARTVEKHRGNFMRKLGLRNHRDLLLYAVRQGLLTQQVGTTPSDEHSSTKSSSSRELSLEISP
jgi:two-component system, NarL family, nitrate/nitrite response regulator NarL